MPEACPRKASNLRLETRWETEERPPPKCRSGVTQDLQTTAGDTDETTTQGLIGERAHRLGHQSNYRTKNARDTTTAQPASRATRSNHNWAHSCPSPMRGAVPNSPGWPGNAAQRSSPYASRESAGQGVPLWMASTPCATMVLRNELLASTSDGCKSTL